MVTSEHTTECQRCGGSLSEDGFCAVCGARGLPESHDVGNKSLREKVEGIFAGPGKGQTRAAPQGATLVDKETGQRFPLTQSVSKIGRDQTNSVALPSDNYISRHHAWILFIKGTYWVEDLGSTNGSELNGEPLAERRQIFSGDRLKVGRTELVFELK